VYKKTFAFLSLTVIIASLFTACSNKNEQPAQKAVSSHADFMGKRVGTITGAIYEQIIEEDFKGTVGYYSEPTAGVEDVRKGRISGFVDDLTSARLLVAQKVNDDLICLPIPHEIFSAPLGAISLDQGVVDRFNVFLAELKTDGTLEDMQNRWLNTMPDLDLPMPDITSTKTNGTLRVVVCPVLAPFAYKGGNGELKGYCIELALRFAAHEGSKIEFSEIDTGGLIVGYIAIQDLTRAGDIIRSRTYDAFFPLLCIAVIYLVVTTICVQIFRLVVNRINGGESG
jgi:ABC-type amino acid transport substrate-binding protein